MWTKNYQMYKMDLEKAEEPIIKMLTSTGSQRKAREFQKHIYFCFIDYAKAFDCADLNNLWKIPIEMGIPTKLLASWETCIQVKKRQVRTRHGTTDCFKIGKGVHQGCTLSLCLFNFMQSTPCRMPSWMTHKLESRLPGEISSTSNIHKMPL